MASTNSIVLVGNLGKDPELRFTPAQKAVCTLSVATKSGYGENETTDWHKITVWEKQGEACAQNLSKGSRVAVTGKLTYERWETKEGEKRVSAVIVAHNVEFLGSKDSGGDPEGRKSDKPQTQQKNATPPSRGFGGKREAVVNDDDIPF